MARPSLSTELVEVAFNIVDLRCALVF